MPKIIAKFGYMKPNNKNKSKYIEYIARRDGVIKNISKNFNRDPTQNQLKLIQKLTNQFPSSVIAPEYKTFEKNKSLGTATEFITYLEETFFNELTLNSNYLDYIAKRPRVVKEDTHGLFSDQDTINLEELKRDVDNHNGNIWTLIISLKREDAHRLGYEDLNAWKVLIRSKRNDLARNLRIDVENFEWFGAFHNEAHHPHAHIVMLAKDGKQGYLDKKGIETIRSSFAREIFKHDLYNIYNKQTIYRDNLKEASEVYIRNTIEEIKTTIKPVNYIDLKLIDLSKKLEFTEGRHVYGYLPKPLKRDVEVIVDLISKEPSVQKFLDLWYEQRQEVLFTYTDKLEERRNLSELKEFNPVKNMVIKLAKEIDTKNLDYKLKLGEPEVLKKVTEVVFDDLGFDEVIELEPITLSNKGSNESKERTKQNVQKIQKQDFPSLKLLYVISRMFEERMFENAKNYHADKEIYKQIKRKKIALGQHKED